MPLKSKKQEPDKSDWLGFLWLVRPVKAPKKAKKEAAK